MRTLPSLLALVAVLLALPACDTVQDNAPTLSGDFEGTASLEGVPTAFALDLSSTVAGNVSGSGTVTTPDVEVPVTVAGTLSFPTITLQLTPTDADSQVTFETLTGTVSDDFDAIVATYGDVEFTLAK